MTTNKWLVKRMSFEKFCDGVIDLDLPYKQRMIKAYDEHQFNILCKFRQGGFSTFNAAWALWKAITEANTAILIVTKTDSEACCMNHIIMHDVAKPNIKSFIKDHNNHQIQFHNGSHIMCFTP